MQKQRLREVNCRKIVINKRSYLANLRDFDITTLLCYYDIMHTLLEVIAT